MGRVLSLIKPKSFEIFFTSWSKILNGSSNGKQIALDGKTLRGSYDNVKGQKALHILNAFAVDSGITLSQLEVDEKTNEITAIPEILDELDIKGSMISVDALNTQKNIAEKINELKADYTLALKGNHKNLYSNVKELFDFEKEDNNFMYSTIEKEHGRISERTYRIIPVDKGNLVEVNEWSNLQAVGRAEAVVLRNDKETIEIRYFLLSYIDTNLFAKSVRNHWGIENQLHWVLDVTFGEDASRKRKDHAPRNYSLIRKFCLNILRTGKGKLSVPLASTKATINENFLTELLINVGFKLCNS
jgi:predicted transposase YbfD/YdcC